MRSKSFSRFFRDKSDVNVTTSFIPVTLLVYERKGEQPVSTYEDLWCIQGIHHHHTRKGYLRT